MWKNVLWGFLLLLVLGAIIFALGPRPVVDLTIRPLKLPPLTALDVYLKKQESQHKDLRPGVEQEIIWADATKKQQTPISIVFLHGYSASRREVSPICENLAKHLKANLFFTRLTGHGSSGEALAQASVNDWLNDGIEALAIGQKLGQKVIVVASSTGATLGTWLALRPEAKQVLAFVMLSPNFGPKDKRSAVLLWPWGEHIVRLVKGPRRSWEPANVEQGKYWTTSYPIKALLPMMALVDLVNKQDFSSIKAPNLWIYSPHDQVLDTTLIAKHFPALGSTTKKLVALKVKNKYSNHILAGDIVAPENTATLYKHVLDFLHPLLPILPVETKTETKTETKSNAKVAAPSPTRP